MKMLYLMDGSGYIFRAYYGMASRTALTAADGTPTHAVYIFNQMLLKLVKEIKKEQMEMFLGIAFDVTKRTFRHELYASYKAQRKEAPLDLVPQIQLIHD